MNAPVDVVQAADAPLSWRESSEGRFTLAGTTDAASVQIEAADGIATLTAYRAGCAAPFYRRRFLSVIEAMDAGEDLAARYGFLAAAA